MSRFTGSKSSAPRKSGSPMLTGILLGMIVGVALAAGLAWFILKSPSPFVNKEQVARQPVEIIKPAVEAAKPAAAVANRGTDAMLAATSGVEDVKPRFEFYKVLTDKQDATVGTPSKAAEKPKMAESKPTVSPKETYLQAGSFVNAADAENLKATLALKGMEASLQTVTIPGKGVMHRVLVGPFQNEQEITTARSTLKSNGLDASPVR